MTDDPQTDDQDEGVSSLPIVLAVVFLVVFSVIFIIELLDLSGEEGGLEDDEVTADAYMDVVTPLLVDADPARAPDLFDEYGCNSCHNNGLGPTYTTIRANAAERRAPMQPEAYIYESIIHPGAFVVDPWQNNMPRNYDEQITDEDLGAMIAYLAGGRVVVDYANGEATIEPVPEVTGPPPIPTPVELTDDLIQSYELQAEFLLSGADPERGEALVEQYGCNSCHGGESAGVVAPGHAGVADVAGERRPPLSPGAYVYEAIIYPGRHVVEGWPNSMPKNYEDLISTQDLGDIMAYLLEGAE
jgi:cytochrome c551/c552